MCYRSIRIAALLVLSLALVTAAAGQDNSSPGVRNSMISGSVVQGGDVPAAGLQVELTNELGQIIAVTQTGSDGGFEFRDVNGGNYFVRVVAGLDEAREHVNVESGLGTV